MLLTPDEIKSIASLAHEPAYNLLLDAVQAQSDDLLDAIELNHEPAKTTTHLATWRALRLILRTLKTKPQEMFNYLEHIRNNAPIEEPEEHPMHKVKPSPYNGDLTLDLTAPNDPE